MVARPVIAGDAGSIEDDGHGKVVHSDVVGRLIDRPGEEGRVDGDNGPQAAHGHAGGSGHLVLLGDTHVDEAIGVRGLKRQEAGGARHGRRQGNDPWVLGRSGEQGARERIGVGGWGDGRTLIDGAAGGHNLDVVQALNLVCLGGGIATTLLGEHVDHDGSIPPGGIAQGLLDGGDVMAVDGSGIANAEGLEEGVRSDKLTQSAGDTVDARIGHFAHGWDLPEDVPEALARLDIGRVEPQARQRLRQLRDGRGITAAIVVEDDDHPSSGMTEVVERLVGHPASEGSVTDDGHDPPLATMAGELALELVGGRHPIGIGEHRRGMRVLDPIVLGFRPIGVTREASLLPEVLEAIAPAREELVDIGLMAGVPQDGVSRRVEDPMESECQLHDSEIGSEVPAGCGHRLDDEGPNLLCELFKLLSRQRPEVLRCLDLRKDHARLTTVKVTNTARILGALGTASRYAEQVTASLDLIAPDLIERVLSVAVERGGDMAEVFCEDRTSRSASRDDGRIEELSTGSSRGAGIRVVVGETTGFAHTADLSEAGLLAAARAASAVAREGGGGTRLAPLEEHRRHDATARYLLDEIPTVTKLELLAAADEAARSAGSAISQVTTAFSEGRRRILVATTDGIYASDDQVRTRFNVMCVATADTGLQTGFESMARTEGFEMFDDADVAEMGRIAARRAMAKLSARPAPSGEVPVVLAGGSGGVLFHEACGHGLEADHIVKDSSVYCGQLGRQVASPLVTLVDDGTVSGEWGTSAIDDEGRPAQRNVLIEDGILTDYMWDWLRARKEGRPSSGNGRRETYKDLPMVRMTNTFLLAGQEDPDEIIAQTPDGVYVAKLGGGQVSTATGDFVFGTTEAYLIEGGRITEPLRDANLIGNGPEVLRRIDALGNDFSMMPGTCGKDGQSVPVGCGQPTLRITGVTIGGTAA